MKPIFTNILQVAIVVRSVDETVRKYADEYGIGPWSIWEFNPETVNDMIIRDKRTDYKMRVAACNIGTVEWEIIEPLDDKSIYYEFLKEHGEGIHHLAYKAEDFKGAMELFRKKGMIVEQGGNWCGQHTYVYLSSQDELKHIAEIYDTKPGFKYPDPIEVYPAEGRQDKLKTPFITNVIQIGIVVKDIRKTAAVYQDCYGIGPWEFYEFNPSTVKDMRIGGERIDHSFTTAATMIGNVELEFMESHDDKNIYADFLRKHGEGLHHVCFTYGNTYEETMKFFSDKGCVAEQSGDWYGCTYVYISSEADLKVISEAYKMIPGFKRPPSDFSYPPKV